MKKARFFVVVLLAVCTLSSCSIFKRGKCDCPTFGDYPPPQQEMVEDSSPDS